MAPKILVTGGAGYIRSQALYTPVVLDNLNTGHRGALKCGRRSWSISRRCATTADNQRVRHTGHHSWRLAYVGEAIPVSTRNFDDTAGSTH